MSEVGLQEAPEAVQELPPSAKLAWLVLEEIEPATQADLCEHTTMPERTVRDALNRLLDREVVTAKPKLSDPRQSLYTVEK
jgi:transcription initiation factor IIE alpha subunit